MRYTHFIIMISILTITLVTGTYTVLNAAESCYKYGEIQICSVQISSCSGNTDKISNYDYLCPQLKPYPENSNVTKCGYYPNPNYPKSQRHIGEYYKCAQPNGSCIFFPDHYYGMVSYGSGQMLSWQSTEGRQRAIDYCLRSGGNMGNNFP